MDTTSILLTLIQKNNLSEKEAGEFLDCVVAGNVSPVQTGAILTALRMKGETVDEITGLVKAMRKHMISVNLSGAIDVCGTGGDRSGTFNISTAVSIVVAGCGVKVAKHGNRAASSKSGSADVLEQLGVSIQLSGEQAEEVFKKVGMVFLFAPAFHPSMKNVVMVRKELKIPTVFNFLGPFANPAEVQHQLIGVPNIEIAQKLSEVGRKLGYSHLIIVSGEEGLDEVSISAKSVMFEIKKTSVKKTVIDPKDYGFKTVSKDAVLGNSIFENAEIIKTVLKGEKGPRRDIVVMNSAVALYAADKVENIEKGITLAETSIDGGHALRVLEQLILETRKYAK